jgi:hypothetical protein
MARSASLDAGTELLGITPPSASTTIVSTMTPTNTQTVYAWVPADWQPDVAPRTLPVVRLWCDVVLELVAELEHRRLEPPVAARRTSVFAWPTPLPPENLAAMTASRRRVRLLVAGERCAVARVELVHELLDPMTWKRIREWLVDRGHDRDLVEEDLVAITDPLAPMLVETARRSVESTFPELLDEIVAYFRPLASRYLDTWAKLSEAPQLDGLEVIVPPEAIIEMDE